MVPNNVDVVYGDAFDALPDLSDDSAHAAVVDYPWEFTIRNSSGADEHRRLPGQGDGEGDRDIDRSDAMFDMASDDRFPELLDEVARVLVDGAWLLCMADDRFEAVIREALEEHAEWVRRRNWAWTPKNMGMGTYGRVNHYPIPTATLGETERYVRDRGTLFEVPNGRDVDYPTGKPVELYRKILAPPVLRDGERLLEPFCGSGPGAAVAASRGVGYWGVDVDAEAVETAREKFNQSPLTQFTEIEG